jgi:hypothetical protein
MLAAAAVPPQTIRIPWRSKKTSRFSVVEVSAMNITLMPMSTPKKDEKFISSRLLL